MSSKVKELNNLKVRRFLKAKTQLNDEQVEKLVSELNEYKNAQDNLKVSFFIDGITEYEYSKIKSVNFKRGYIKLKNKVKIAIQDIEEIKKL